MTLRRSAVTMAIPVAFLGAMGLWTGPAAHWLAQGPIQQGHAEVSCQGCHTPSPGTTRQQVQARFAFAIGRRDSDVDFGNGRITNIFGYRDYTGDSIGDIDASPITFFHSGAELSQEQFSNELRYAGTFGKADVTTGLYYFEQEIAYTETRNLPTPRPATLPATIPWGFYGGGRQDHTVWGAFANVDYSLTDKLVGTLGLWSCGVESTASESSGDDNGAVQAEGVSYKIDGMT